MKILSSILMFVVVNLLGATDCFQEKYAANVKQFKSGLGNLSNNTNLERTKEDIMYYRNGNIKHKTIYFYDPLNTRPYQVTEIRYRKNGNKRNISILDYGVLTRYQARYNKDGIVILEKIYTYNFKNTLIKIETIKDGISTYRIFETDIFGDPVCE